MDLRPLSHPHSTWAGEGHEYHFQGILAEEPQLPSQVQAPVAPLPLSSVGSMSWRHPGSPPNYGLSQHESNPPLCSGQSADFEEDLAECIAAWQVSKPRSEGPPSRPKSLHSTFNSSREAAARLIQEPGPIVVVNVGGKIFRTTSSTLRKARFFDSLMKYAEDGKMGTTVDDDGHFFVDRSSELFSYILEYLRSGLWVLRDKASDPAFVEALREEAGFYGLDPNSDRFPIPRISEYVTVWQFREDTSLYVDSHEQTIREDPDHQGLFRLCKYSGGLPLDQQTCTKPSRRRLIECSPSSHTSQCAVSGFNMSSKVP
jgi:hypothetical protein